jgi:hypothetical protein
MTPRTSRIRVAPRRLPILRGTRSPKDCGTRQDPSSPVHCPNASCNAGSYPDCPQEVPKAKRTVCPTSSRRRPRLAQQGDVSEAVQVGSRHAFVFMHRNKKDTYGSLVNTRASSSVLSRMPPVS